MIGRLCGILLEKQPLQVLVDCAGVGYEVSVPMSTFYNLPPEGQKITLLTHLAIREDAHVLFGFEKPSERAAFRELIKVSGIGSRTALSILSGMSIDDLSQAIVTQDAARLVKVPGIGKKTADRLLLELRGKFSGADMPALSPAQTGMASGAEDIIAALISLGYSDKEARAAVKLLPADVGASEGIRLALKTLYRDKS